MHSRIVGESFRCPCNFEVGMLVGTWPPDWNNSRIYCPFLDQYADGTILAVLRILVSASKPWAYLMGCASQKPSQGLYVPRLVRSGARETRHLSHAFSPLCRGFCTEQYAYSPCRFPSLT